MLSITFVVAILFIAMMTQSISVEKQLSQYQQELEELDNKMTEETERTKEIDDMKEYMKQTNMQRRLQEISWDL